MRVISGWIVVSWIKHSLVTYWALFYPKTCFHQPIEFCAHSEHFFHMRFVISDHSKFGHYLGSNSAQKLFLYSTAFLQFACCVPNRTVVTAMSWIFATSWAIIQWKLEFIIWFKFQNCLKVISEWKFGWWLNGIVATFRALLRPKSGFIIQLTFMHLQCAISCLNRFRWSNEFFPTSETYVVP